MDFRTSAVQSTGCIPSHVLIFFKSYNSELLILSYARRLVREGATRQYDTNFHNYTNILS